MLSIENRPPDPPYPQLNTTGTDHDKRASLKLSSPELDLSKPDLVHDPPLISNFSIRDYVFTARNKDIRTNWPFSAKTLELCLKHGVKDLLPPFQPTHIIPRNPLIKGCMDTVENSSSKKKNICNSAAETFSGPNKHGISDSCDDAKLILNKKHAQSFIGPNPCKSEGANGLPSTTDILSQPGLDLNPTGRPSSSPNLETDSFSQVPVAVEASSRKTDSQKKASGKKCRLMMKYKNHFDQSPADNIASSSASLSETMASKICPVCKTFSSSSNTTLNAHIDQCLSLEPTPKWTPDSKLPRHRIKPRKTKLMVDIYTTALPCTLEDLDKRNGTTWAKVSSGLLSEGIHKPDTSPGGKKQRAFVHPEDTGNAGGVYIDANGTKLRILSKFNEAPLHSKVHEDLALRKPLKGDKVSKLHSAEKKRHHASKLPNYQNFAAQNQKVSTHMALSSQIDDGQDGYHGLDERNKREEHQIQKQVKPNGSGSLRQWACSKRTGVAKKVTRKEGHQLLKFKWHVSRDSLIETDQPCLVDFQHEGSQVQEQTNDLSADPVSSPESSERMDNPLYEVHISDKKGWSPRRKTVGSPLCPGMIRNSYLPALKRSANQLSKGNAVAGDDCLLQPPNKKRFHGHRNPINNSDVPLDRARPSWDSHATEPEATDFSSSRKNVLSVSSQASMTGSRSHVAKKHLSLRKSQVHIKATVDKVVVAWHGEADQQCCLSNKSTESQCGKEGTSEELSPREFKLIRTNDRGVMTNAMALRSSLSTGERYRQSGGNSSARVDTECKYKNEGLECARNAVQTHEEDLIINSSSNIAVEETVTTSCRSMDPVLPKQVDNSRTVSSSLQLTEKGSMSLCEVEVPGDSSGPYQVDGQEMFCATEVSDGIIGQNVHPGEELDSEFRLENAFPEVDPIPIPGPPGSYLPSPGDMGLDEVQGNSSLTSSRDVQSSQGQHDCIDGDQSNSPISATSTISDSVAARSDDKDHELSPAEPDAFQEKLSHAISDASLKSLVENAASVPQLTCTGADRATFHGENFHLSKLSVGKAPLSFRDDDQRCCCQRKDKVYQGGTCNIQQAQSVKHRAIASTTKPNMENQVGYNLNARPRNMDARPEMIPLMRSFPSTEKHHGGPFSSNKAVKLSECGNQESFSPTPCNPVLRLMGKNLMVLSKDEDSSMLIEQPPQPSFEMNYNISTSQVRTSSGALSGVQNQGYHHSLQQRFHQGCVSDQDPCNSNGNYFSLRVPSNGFNNGANLVMHQTHEQGCAGMCVMEPDYEYKGDCDVIPGPLINMGKSRPNEAISNYKMNGVVNNNFFPVPPRWCAASSPIKEVIVIDDIPDCEANLSSSKNLNGSYSGGLNLRTSSLTSGGGIPINQMDAKCNSRHVRINPAYSCYQYDQDPSCCLLSESAATRNGSSILPMSSRQLVNGSPVWMQRGCTTDSPSVVGRSPLVGSIPAAAAAAPSSSHGMRSAVVYNSRPS